jgi:glucose-6-phosphate dehydrogenase assembly protein OpcA
MSRNTATAVALSEVESEWGRLMKSEQPPGETPVIQARMSNLLIYCNRVDLARELESEIPAVVAAHPARILLLVGELKRRDGEMLAFAEVRVHQEEGRKICCEQVTLYAHQGHVDRLPYAVRGLLIGDLPTNIWWATPDPPPALAGPLFYELAEEAQQLVYDSQGWLEPHRTMALTASWLEKFERHDPGRWRVASDLSWRRLKTWRRLLSQALDPATAPGVLESISEVLVEHGPHAVTQAWQLIGWLASRLNWQVEDARLQPGVELSWKVQAAHGQVSIRIRRLSEGPPEVRRVHIACIQNGKPAGLNFIVEDERRLALVAEGTETASRTLALQRPSLAELISRQLSDRESDPVFRESMAVAQVFAQSLAK